MVNALIKLDENANRILNFIKAKYGFKDKSEAVAFVVNKYIDDEGEPDLRPEFINKIRKIQKQKSIKVDDFSARYGLIE